MSFLTLCTSGIYVGGYCPSARESGQLPAGLSNSSESEKEICHTSQPLSKMELKPSGVWRRSSSDGRLEASPKPHEETTKTVLADINNTRQLLQERFSKRLVLRFD